jgi:MFS family permease
LHFSSGSRLVFRTRVRDSDQAVSPETAIADKPAVSFPIGLHNAFLFAAFNALSFPIILNSPMVLYAKSLGASATVLGIIAGMMPLLVISQIPAANHINRIGHKRFVFSGWGTRILFIFGLAIVSLLGGFLDSKNQLAIVMVLLFCFNLSRGISSCAWLPWITALVPPDLRGKYLVRDAAMQNLGSFVSFLVAAALLGGAPRSWQFSVLFGFSAIMGAASLVFLKRIPDVPTLDDGTISKGRVPWLEITRHPPFRKLLRENVAWSLAYGGLTTFAAIFLKMMVGMSEGKILLITSVSFLGGLSSLWLIGSRLDRLGSKPVLTCAFMVWFLVLGGWIALAGGILKTQLPLILILEILMGLLAAVVTMSNTRLAMAVIPVMGRNHFFAIYSVLGNLTLGLAPIGWGLLIDAFGTGSTRWLGVEWNRFTVFFAAASVVFLLALALARRLDEPQAASLEKLLREVLVQSPQRFWFRVWPRG